MPLLEDTISPLETMHHKKRNGNNLIGHVQNDVTGKLPISLYFVNSLRPARKKSFAKAIQCVRRSTRVVYNCCHMLHIHPGASR
jgi:hypothetical protein